MKNHLDSAQDAKLTVICRIEPGCLGPKGKDHIDRFCSFAQKEIDSIGSDFVHCVIVPRHDNSLAETQYLINNKNLPHEKASRYLSLLKQDIVEFERHLDDTIIALIDQYLGR